LEHLMTDQAALPCVGNADLYDLVLFDDEAPAAARTQAVHRAAALCAGCPRPCEQKVTADSGPAELVLLEPDWMPPQREGRPDPKPQTVSGRKRTKEPDIQVGADYVPTNRRVAVWAEMCADRAALGHSGAHIAGDVCVSEGAGTRRIAIGRQARGWAA